MDLQSYSMKLIAMGLSWIAAPNYVKKLNALVNKGSYMSSPASSYKYLFWQASNKLLP